MYLISSRFYLYNPLVNKVGLGKAIWLRGLKVYRISWPLLYVFKKDYLNCNDVQILTL